MEDAGIEEGGVEGGDAGADVVTPPGCDPTAEPKDAPKCVVSDYGVFVDAQNGAEANPGTKEAPVKTITGALGKLAGSRASTSAPARTPSACCSRARCRCMAASPAARGASERFESRPASLAAVRQAIFED